MGYYKTTFNCAPLDISKSKSKRIISSRFALLKDRRAVDSKIFFGGLKRVLLSLYSLWPVSFYPCEDFINSNQQILLVSSVYRGKVSLYR